MTQSIVILGAGGFAREVLDVIEAMQAAGADIEPAGFIVDTTYFRRGEVINDLPVLGDFDWLHRNSSGYAAICAVGSPSVRMRMTDEATRMGVEFTTVIHPRATLTPRVSIGVGVVVTAGVVVTTNVYLGDHVHLNLNCTVGHDAVLEEYSTLAPGVHISGNVAVGKGAYLGTGSVVLEGTTVGSWSTVGAGAMVNREVPPDATAVGVPAKVIKVRETGWQLDDSH